MDYADLEKVEFERFLSGAGGPNINLQGVVLRMLEEQGLASRFPNGFSLDASVAASLDNEPCLLLLQNMKVLRMHCRAGVLCKKPFR